MLDGVTQPPDPTFTDQDAADAEAAAAAAEAAYLQADLDAAAAGASASSRINTAAAAAAAAAQAIHDEAAATFQGEIDSANAELSDAHAAAGAAFQTAEDESEQTYTQELEDSEQQTQAEDAASLSQYNDDLAAAEQAFGTAEQAATDALAAANAALQAALAASELQIEGDYQSGNAAAEASYQSDLAGIMLAYDGAVEAADQTKTAAIDAANTAFTSTVSAAAAARDSALASYSGVAYDAESVAQDAGFLSAVAAAQSAYDAAVAAAQDAFVDAVLGAYGVYDAAMSAAEAALSSATLIANGHRTDAYAAANAAYAATSAAAAQTLAAAATQAGNDKAQAIAAANASYNSAEAAIAATRTQTLLDANEAYLEARAEAQQQYDSDFGTDSQYFSGQIQGVREEFLEKLNQAISTYDGEMAAANTAFQNAATSNLQTYKSQKDAAWATYQGQRAAYEAGGGSTFDWAIYISAKEIEYYAELISHDELLQVYKDYAVAQAEEHVRFLIALRSYDMQYLNTERGAATQLAENMAGPTLDHAEAAAEAAAELATTRLNETAKADRLSAQWESELWISEAYYWADLQIALAEAEKAKLDVETQANLAYDLAEEGLNLTRQKALITADAACNDAMTQAEAARAQALANATFTRTVAYASAERSYVNEVAQASQAFAISSNAAVVAFGQSVIAATGPYANSVTTAYFTAGSAVETARSTAITAASSGDPDMAFVASTWATFGIATRSARMTQQMTSHSALATYETAELNAWRSAADQNAAAQTTLDNAQADAGYQWALDIAGADLQAALAGIDAEASYASSVNSAEKAKAESQADADSSSNRRSLQATADQAGRDANAALNRTKDAHNHERDKAEQQITAETTALLKEIDASKTEAQKLIDADKDKAIAAARAAKAEVPAGAAEDKRIALADAERTLTGAVSGAFAQLRGLKDAPLSNFEGNPGPGIGAALNWMYNDGLDQAANFMTGWMDGLSGGWWSYFGQGTYLTQYVDYSSGAYGGGSIVGSVHGFVLGAAAGPCAAGWAGTIARGYTATMTGVGLVEAGHHALQGQMGLEDFLALAPVAGRLGGRVLGFNCFVAGTPVATGWIEAPQLAVPVPVTSSGFERTSWIAIGLGTVFFTSAAARRLRRSDDDESPRPRVRAQRPVLSGWDRFDEEQRCDQSDHAGVDENDVCNRSVRSSATVECESGDKLPLTETRPTVVPGKDPLALQTRRHIRSALAAVVSLCGLLTAGLCFWHSGAETGGLGEARASAAATAGSQSAPPTLSTTPIEQIRPGMRVLADNPELAGSPQPDSPITAKGWRLVRLQLNNEDGGRVDVDLLRPLDWLLIHALSVQESPRSAESHNLNRVEGEEGMWQALLVGRSIELDLPELGAQGAARVIAVDPCPSLDSPSNERRLVTGAFRHMATSVVEVTLADASPSIGTTSNHPFWSVDRQTFVRADELRAGERLQKADGGTTSVARVTPRAGQTPVYNFEVDAEHVYFVGAGGVLVHNQCHHMVSIYDNLRRPAAAAAIQKSRRILQRAGIGLESIENAREVSGHIAKRHSIDFHVFVSNSLEEAVKNKTPNTSGYTSAVKAALNDLFDLVENNPGLMY